MITQALFPYFVIFFGIFVFSLGLPKVREVIIAPLQEKGYLPTKKLKARDREIISDAGENLSLMFAGIIIILIGTVLLFANT
ncbi:MAG: hypothetical protein AAB871_01180 [Patescibacteria group bacterium]